MIAKLIVNLKKKITQIAGTVVYKEMGTQAL
jgi:hypothetical protein